MSIKIPEELKNQDFRFIKLEKNSKRPIEKEWQFNNNYIFNDENIISHLEGGGNYGILTGNGFAVVDDDTKDFKLTSLIEQNIGETFTVETGSGGRHLYFKIFTNEDEEETAIKFFDSIGIHLGEMQFKGQQVVGPNSIHPDTKKPYKILKNIPIKSIHLTQIREVLKEYIVKKDNVIRKCSKTDFTGEKIEDIPISNIISFSGMVPAGSSSYQGEHPVHGSTTGMNFRIDTSKNCWHCFRCNSGGGPSELIAVMEGVIDCSQAGPHCFSKEQGREIIEIARKNYGLEEPEDIFNQIRKSKKETKLKKDGINFIEEDFYDSWEKIKGRTINILKKGESEIYFFSHSKDEIFGKPRLISQTIKRIPIISKTIKQTKEGEIVKYNFIDDSIDKRTDGYIKKSLNIPFYIYGIVCDDEEFLLLSENKIGLEFSLFRGMKIQLIQSTEFDDLKLRNFTTIFLVKDSEPAIKPLSKEELITYAKHYFKDEKKFNEFLFTHPDGNYYACSPLFEQLFVSQLLSGKQGGYPLHLLLCGPLGLGKTTIIESINDKAQEPKGIFEASNSTFKGLIPSFKTSLADPGYLLSCHRIALTDELFKLIERENFHNPMSQLNKQYFGSLNPLLEHKKRTSGSGNSKFDMEPTFKALFCTNALKSCKNLESHMNVLDQSTISRLFPVVQDAEEQEFVSKNVPYKTNAYGTIYNKYLTLNKDSQISQSISHSLVSNIVFLNVYDSCNSFLADIELPRIKQIKNELFDKVPKSMKDIWSRRSEHHLTLLADGIIKKRCLFKDRDSKFKGKEEDYVLLKKIAERVVKGWSENFDKSDHSWRDSFNVEVERV